MIYFFYYLPLGLDVRGTRVPWASALLVCGALAGFVTQLVQPTWLWLYDTWFAYVPAAPQPSALFLNAYMHGDLLHLVSNLIALWVFGPALEERLGAWRYLLLFHVANASANLVQGATSLLLLPQLAEIGVVGASGAIAALMGLALVRLHFARVRIGYWAFLPLQAFTRAGAVHLSVPVAVLLWFLLQWALVVIAWQGGNAQIAVGSHLGGLAFGVGIGLLAGLRAPAAAESALQAGRRYASAAQWYAAQGHLLDYVRSCPDDAEGRLELGRALRATQRDEAADEHYRAACAAWARAGRWDRLEAAFCEALRGNARFVLDAALQMQMAQLYERTLRLQAAEEAYVAYARHYPAQHAGALALFRAARLARRRGAGDTARMRWVELVRHYPESCESDLARSEIQRLDARSEARAA